MPEPQLPQSRPPLNSLATKIILFVFLSTFATALVVYGHQDVEWDDQFYADAQIKDASRLWSPVDAWARHGVGEVVDGSADGWGLYQAWVDDKPAAVDGDGISGGHQWLYNARHKIRLHSSSRAGRVTMDRFVEWGDLADYYKDGIKGVAL